MESFSLEILALLVGSSFLAGFIDTIAGGGGLLTIPALLIAGLPPTAAIATNKVQAMFGLSSATFAFARAKMVNWREARVGIVCAFASACLGALAIQAIDPSVLRGVIPFLLIALALYFAIAPNLSDEPRHRLISPSQHGLTAGSAIGFYDGMFGPGTGSFLTVSFVTLVGYGLKKATAHAKVFNLASNLGSLAVFLITGKALVLIGLVMALGQICGAFLGAHMAIKHGARIIRPLLVIVCCALAVKLLLS